VIETLAFVGLIAVASLAIGVLLGRYYVPDDRALQRAAGHGKSYIKAINHLVGRNRDAAITELLAVVEDDVEELEPYFALAALFRSRGEWERAIRVHQAIELRGADDDDIRRRALYELGLDFRMAGMPRRATRAMEECVREDGRHVGALRALTGLYEEQGRFAEAAEAWERLAKIDGHRSPREVHLYAAAAERALPDDIETARAHVRHALRLAPREPHAHIAAAAVARAGGHMDESREHLIAALKSKSDLATFVLPALLASSPPSASLSSEKQVFAALSEMLDQVADPVPIELVMAALETSFSPTAAGERIRRLGESHSHDLGLRVRAGRRALEHGEAKEIERELAALVGERGPLAWLVVGRWRCASCARSEDRFYWRCPGCRHWGTAEVDDGVYLEPSAVRERRQFSRSRGGSVLVASDGLPEPRIARTDLEEVGQASSAGRAIDWLSGAWDSLRRKS